jgi:uncharacterized protein involved in response to NO
VAAGPAPAGLIQINSEPAAVCQLLAMESGSPTNARAAGQSRGEYLLLLRRERMAAAPPFLRGGFRPFFFGGATWAAAAVLLWLPMLVGLITLPSAFDPLAWHRHEMLFGFVGAVIAGFLLTAIPNWTGRLPIAGAPLAAFAGLWLAARVAVLFSATVGPAVAAALDVGFYLLLAALSAREILAAKNRNLPIVGIVLLIGLANAADHAANAGLIEAGDGGLRGAIALVVLLVSVIGGRIVPSFTRNWMARRGIKDRLPTQPGRFDLGVIAVTAIGMLAWIVASTSPLAGTLLLAAGVLQAARLSRWGGLRTIRDPLVIVLHVGYAWIPVGLLLLGFSILEPSVPRSAAIHALTTGAFGTMILAVMTRATLGHTGRELNANAPTALLYLLVTIAALLRVIAALGWVPYLIGLEISAAAWVAAFVIFLAVYGPMMFRARAGEN